MLYVYASVSWDCPNQAACAISCVNQHLCNTLPVSCRAQTRRCRSLGPKSANVVVFLNQNLPGLRTGDRNASLPSLKVAPAYDFYKSPPPPCFSFYPATKREVFPVQGLRLFVSEFDWIRYLQYAAAYGARHTKAICREMIPL